LFRVKCAFLSSVIAYCFAGATGFLDAADMKALNTGYANAANALRKEQRLSSVIVYHDREVLQKAFDDLEPQLEKKGFTSGEAASTLTGAWTRLRATQSIAPDSGVTREHLDDFFSKVQSIVIDSAPRKALVVITPDGGNGPIETRRPVLLKRGETFKIRFSLAGYADREETIVAGQTSPVICRELQPLDSRLPKPTCPK
jgi:hypothetical protein